MRTTKFLVSLVCRIRVSDDQGEAVPNEDELIECHLDEVMDELLALDALDPAIDLDLERKAATFAVAVEASDPLEAANNASGFIRSAIHAAKGSTPDWPGPTHNAWSVQILSLSADPVPAHFEEDAQRMATVS